MLFIKIIGYLGLASFLLGIISFIVPPRKMKTSTKIYILIIAGLLTYIAYKEDAFSLNSSNHVKLLQRCII